MNVLQIGYPKSGNFWLYQILQQIFSKTGKNTPSYVEKHPIQKLAQNWELNYPEQATIDMIDITDLQVVFRISSIFKMPVEDLSEYVKKTNHVWTHSPVCNQSVPVFEHFGKRIYIIRDPRDVMISASKYYCSDYMLKYFPQEEKEPQRFLEKNFDRMMKEWVWHVWDYLRICKAHNIHICFYEGFLLDFQKELFLLLNYLEISLSASEKNELEQAVSFKTLKKENPKHLKRGSSGYWMNQMNKTQISKAESIAGPLLDFLGYPNEGEEMSYSREYPHEDFQKLKKEIIDSQQVFYK